MRTLWKVVTWPFRTVGRLVTLPLTPFTPDKSPNGSLSVWGAIVILGGLIGMIRSVIDGTVSAADFMAWLQANQDVLLSALSVIAGVIMGLIGRLRGGKKVVAARVQGARI